MNKDLIIKNILFTTLSNEDIEKLILKGILKFAKYKKGQTIHSALEKCTRIDLVLFGTLTAYNLSENGSAISVFDFAANNLIGCNLLFSNANSYPLNIYCTSDCEIAFIEKSDVTNLIENNANFAMKFIEIISNYSINLNRKMLTFNHKTLRERILEYLEKEQSVQNSNTIKLAISKKQLADEFGVQRPSLFRELKKMKDENLIDYNSNSITLNKKIDCS